MCTAPLTSGIGRQSGRSRQTLAWWSGRTSRTAAILRPKCWRITGRIRAGILREEGVLVDVEELSRLPHDVEISERLRTRIATT